MKKIIGVTGILYFGAALYLSDWLLVLSFVAFVMLLYMSKALLKIRTGIDLKNELTRYWGEFLTAVVGSLALPYLVYLKSEADTELALLFVIMIVPNAFLIGYLWLRGINRFFSAIRNKVIRPKQ